MNQGSEVKKVKVLVVEDQPDLRMIYERYLATQSYLVFLAENGKRALELIDVVQPDVIITDIVMPVMDGFDFIRNYREAGGRLPVIAMSSCEAYLDQLDRFDVQGIFCKVSPIKTLFELIKTVSGGAPATKPSFPSQLVEEEASRLVAIRRLKLDEVAAERSLHEFIEFVGGYFDCPTALFSVVTDDRQFWTAGCGMPAEFVAERGTARSDSFCTHAVAAKSALIVQDAWTNPYFKDNPFVVNQGLRFYAGVPLVARRGDVLGTLCIIDAKPRTFTYFDLELLGVFGKVVLSYIEKREMSDFPDLPESAFLYHNFVDDEFKAFGRPAIREFVTIEGCRAIEKAEKVVLAVMAVDSGYIAKALAAMRSEAPLSLIGRIGKERLAWIVPQRTEDVIRKFAKSCGIPFKTTLTTQLDMKPGKFLQAFEDLEVGLPQ